MKQRIERLVLLLVLAIGLTGAWLAPLDRAATQVVDTGLKRAVVSFASARTLNAALSVAQSADVSAKPGGVGVSITLGQVLHPINELVGQFAELMLAACVAFGAMKFLIVIGGAKVVSLLLTLAALWWSWLYWLGKARPSLLSKTLLVLVLIRFAVPVASVGSEMVFQELLSADYITAQAGITDIPALGLPATIGDPAKEAAESGVLATIKGWWSNTTGFPAQVEMLKISAEKWVRHIIDLIVLFLLQTLVVPLFLFWILCRIGSSVLTLGPIPRRPN